MIKAFERYSFGVMDLRGVFGTDLYVSKFRKNMAWNDPPAILDDGDMTPFVGRDSSGDLFVILLCAQACLTHRGPLHGGFYTSAANEASLRTLMLQERSEAWGG